MAQDYLDDPTPEELDMIEENTVGKPVDKGTALANLQALRRRIDLLETQEKKIAGHVRSGRFSEAEAKPTLANIRQNLGKARQLAADYQGQLETLN